jgi:hypothetical protein
MHMGFGDPEWSTVQGAGSSVALSFTGIRRNWSQLYRALIPCNLYSMFLVYDLGDLGPTIAIYTGTPHCSLYIKWNHRWKSTPWHSNILLGIWSEASTFGLDFTAHSSNMKFRCFVENESLWEFPYEICIPSKIRYQKKRQEVWSWGRIGVRMPRSQQRWGDPLC